MAAVTSADIFQLTVVSRYANQTLLNVLHYRMVGHNGMDHVAACVDLIDTVKDAGGLLDKMRNCWTTQVTVEKLWAQIIRPTRYSRVEASFSGLTGIQTTATHSTANVAAAITKRTDLSGRKFRGRMQLLIPSDSAVVGLGVILPTFKATIQQLADMMAQQLVVPFGEGESFIPILLHAKNVTPNWTDLRECITQPEVRTQRTRTVGKGQ